MNEEDAAVRATLERRLETFYQRVRQAQNAVLWMMFSVFVAPWLGTLVQWMGGEEPSFVVPVTTSLISAIPLLVFVPIVWRMRRIVRWTYFHPQPMHPPRRDCDASCGRKLSTLEQMAVAAAEPPPEPPLLFWLVWDGKWTPFSLKA